MSTFQSKAEDGRVSGENREHNLSRDGRKKHDNSPTWTRRHPPPRVDEVAGSEFL